LCKKKRQACSLLLPLILAHSSPLHPLSPPLSLSYRTRVFPSGVMPLSPFNILIASCGACAGWFSSHPLSLSSPPLPSLFFPCRPPIYNIKTAAVNEKKNTKKRKPKQRIPLHILCMRIDLFFIARRQECTISSLLSRCDSCFLLASFSFVGTHRCTPAGPPREERQEF
jgi:hypothetical protein